MITADEHRSPPPDLTGVVRVPIAALNAADSPRLAGESIEHVHTLAESDATLPPIAVHRPTMRVIDGMHRLRAAIERGEQHIDARFFDGDIEHAFVLAVQANVAHGLPLSRADRAAAAARILRDFPDWSDRAVGEVTGLSHKTIATIRRRATGEVSQSHTRIGRDGRKRPVDGTATRQAVREYLEREPTASLRAAARATGVSPATVRDVRAKLARAEAEVPGQRTAPAAPEADYESILARLRGDPAVRLSAAGRMLLHLLGNRLTSRTAWRRLANAVPLHCAGLVAAAARQLGTSWHEFAQLVETRDRESR
jgi:ParB-like chromosome segregation protein Spo0J